MKPLYIFIALLLHTLLPANAQQSMQNAIGEWQTYISYHNPTRCEVAGSKLMILASGGLYSYDKDDTSLQTFSKGSPLSDTEIYHIAYHKEQKTLIIVYTNANIDLMVDEEDIYNLPHYKDKNMAQDKTVSHTCFYQHYAYLSTASGILCIDLKKREINNYYNLNKEVMACAVVDNILYAATNEGVLAGNLSSNLLDAANWNKVQDDTSEFISQHHDIPFKEDVEQIPTPDSPKRNYPYYMSFTADNKLLIAGGGHIADRLRRKGTIMTLQEDGWQSFQEDGIEELTGHLYQDINCVVQHPNNPTHHFAASAGEGIYEFKEQRLVNWYSMHNSPLESALPNDEKWAANYVRVNGLIYDNENNLWMVSSEATHAVNVLMNNGNWVSLHYPEIVKASNFGRTMFDRRGWLWATSSRIESGGVFCLDYNKTIENATDDRHKFITRFTNQDGIILEQLAVYCIAQDRDGAIWIGTNKGPLVLGSPSRFFNDDFYCTQVKVPRNDGSNLADLLLVNETINAIAIDGANRKWIGTSGSGIYLLSPDGLETIHHFTEENSQLLSNSIESIAIHPLTGKVFIGTSKGLVSYQSDATEPESSFNESLVRAYPNPVKPHYNGPITITGLVYSSDVKIVNAAGELIHQGTSLGGQFTWDGINKQGKRVASGVYMVLAADSEGREGVVCKVLVVR